MSPQPEPQNRLTLLEPKLLLFDVYETLLDMTYIRRKINSLLDSKKAYTYWFERLMQYCLVDNSVGVFHPFTVIAKAALQTTAYTAGRTIDEATQDEVIQLFDHLPVNEGVSECLSLLSNLNIKVAALTNASKAIIEERMENTGLISYFERVLSAEEIKKYKPSASVYQWALKELDVAPADVLYVSSHGWDIAGAASAGMKTVYFEHSEHLFYPLADPPDFRFPDFTALVQALQGENPNER